MNGLSSVVCPICGVELSEDDQSQIEERDDEDALTDEDFAAIFGPVLSRLFDVVVIE